MLIIKDSKGYVVGKSYIYGGVEQARKIVNDLHGTGTHVVPRKEG